MTRTAAERPVRLVSLSHVNDPAVTPIFPGDPEFVIAPAATVAVDGYFLNDVHQGEHTGTHWGAPGHFEPGGRLADDLDLDDLFRPAVVVDVREPAAADPDYAISVDDLLAAEHRHGRFPHEAAVLGWTGWSRRWGTPGYPNRDPAGVAHQPGFSLEAAEWLLEQGVLGQRGALGTDTFGPDRGVDRHYPVSTLLYHERRISLENLTNLERLPPTGAWVLVGGPINRRGSGSPASIFGVLPAD